MASIISAGTTSGTALNMSGDTTGNLAFQTAAGANTISVPNGTGTMVVNGVNSPLVSGTAQASTSGTSIDFTSIPSWVKRITVIFNGVSTSGSSNYQIQLGTGGTPTTTGYTSNACRLYTPGGPSYQSATTGFLIPYDGAAYTPSGQIVFTNISGNTWVVQGTVGTPANGLVLMIIITTGTVTLGGTLNLVRITTVNGTDTFDAGSINIQYE